MPLDDTQDTSIEGLLGAAFAADAAASAPAPKIEQASIPDPAAKSADAAAPASEAPKAEGRDEKGRFVPKTETQAPTAPEATTAPETKSSDLPEAKEPEAPQGEPIRAPAAWSPAAKAKFATLDPVIQAEVAKREQDMANGLQKQGVQLKRLERLEEAIAPHRNRLAMSGVAEDQYLRALIAADEMLRTNPAQALPEIARMYGFDLGQPAQAQQQPNAPGTAPAQLPPQYGALVNELNALKSTLAHMQSTAQDAEVSKIQSEIDAFAKDHPYFENVRGLMGKLINATPELTLAQAYDMAIHAAPDVRAVVLQEEQDRKAQAARAEAEQRAAAARQAAGSVTGAPTPGATPAQAPAQSIGDLLRSGFRDAGLIA